MSYNQNQVRQYIIDTFNHQKIKYEIYDFESGATMIHVWHKDKFYAIQPEPESVGLSLIENDNPGFDTIPDNQFFDFKKFVEAFTKIFG